MKITSYALLALFVCGLLMPGAVPAEARHSDEDEAGEESTPPTLQDLFRASGLARDHRLVFSKVNPFYLAGDFDGDGKEDFVCWITPRNGGRTSPARLLVLRGSGKVSYPQADAGEAFPAGDAWYVVHSGASIPSRPEHNAGAKPPNLTRDAFLMMKLESAGAVIYWDGKRFKAYWISD